MKEIQCPKCDSVFEMDASGYSDIVNQIRGKEFEQELNQRLKDQESNHKVKLELAEQNVAAEKDKLILNLQNQIDHHAREIEIAKNEALTSIREDLLDVPHRATSGLC